VIHYQLGAAAQQWASTAGERQDRSSAALLTLLCRSLKPGTTNADEKRNAAAPAESEGRPDRRAFGGSAVLARQPADAAGICRPIHAASTLRQQAL